MAENDDSEAIRLTAFFLWEQDGRPEGREVEYWLRAIERHRRQREFDRMIADGAEDVGEVSEGK
jgi:hypothetical protein